MCQREGVRGIVCQREGVSERGSTRGRACVSEGMCVRGRERADASSTSMHKHIICITVRANLCSSSFC